MLRHMRTTVRLDEHLMAQVKSYAAKQGKTLTAVIEQALRETISRRPATKRQATVRFPTVTGKGMRAGLSLDDSAQLLEFMER